MDDFRSKTPQNLKIMIRLSKLQKITINNKILLDHFNESFLHLRHSRLDDVRIS